MKVETILFGKKVKLQINNFKGERNRVVYGLKDRHTRFIDMMRRINHHKALPTNVTNVLDIGCGLGWGCEYLRLNWFKNANYYGIENNKYCLDMACTYRINIISKDINNGWESDYKNFFDFIFMRHSLEHFINPIDVLKKVSNALHPKGIVYIAVPDISIYNSMDRFSKEHISYFTKDTLNTVVKLGNLKPLHYPISDFGNVKAQYVICKKG